MPSEAQQFSLCSIYEGLGAKTVSKLCLMSISLCYDLCYLFSAQQELKIGLSQPLSPLLEFSSCWDRVHEGNRVL